MPLVVSLPVDAQTLDPEDFEVRTVSGEVCEGADCAAGEELLRTTFPCSFVVPFTATR